MATSLLGRALAPFRPTSTRSASQESVISAATVDSSSHTRLSDSSTPPTSAADSESISSGAVKRENTDNVNAKPEEDSDLEADGATPRDYGSAGRSRRPRSSYPGSYNLKVLSGTAMHAPKKFRNGDSNGAKMLTRRRTISGDTLVDPISDTSSFIGSVKKEPKAHARIGMDALDLHNSDKKTAMLRSRAGLGLGEGAHRRKAPQKDDETSFRRATRSAGEPVESLTAKLTVLGKRGRNKFEAGLVKAKRELRRLADTKEFAKIDTKPVVEEVWSNGKLWTGEEAPKKRVKVESATGVKPEEELKTIEEVKLKQNRQKLWLNKGLYAGQEVRNLDWFAALSKDEKKKMVNIPAFKPNGVLPLPMWHGQRLLHTGRHFKLPFDVCSPLPPGQPKPDEWRKVPKSMLPNSSQYIQC
jgi:histone-lysine N-methyltransferase ASH1L